MAKKKQKPSGTKKTRKAASQKHSSKVSEGKETLFFEWLRQKVHSYCHDPSISKKDQLNRRQELAKHLGIKESTLKGQYLYGQNKENIYKAAIHIGAIKEEVLMSFIETYPALADDLKSLPEYLKRFYSNFKKLNEKEQELLSNFVENLLELNKKYENRNKQ